MWDDRITAVKEGAINALADNIMERWFSKSFHSKTELNIWRNMLTRKRMMDKSDVVQPFLERVFSHPPLVYDSQFWEL